MRKLTAVVIAGALAACGGSDKNNGGGGTGTSLTVGGPAPLTGTLTDATSLIVQDKSCTFSVQGTPVGVTISFALLAFSTTNSCQALQQSRDPANATVGAVSLVRFRLGSGQSAPLVAGTYAFWDGSSFPSNLDAQGAADVFEPIGFAKNGTTTGTTGCDPVAGGQAEVTGGTVTVTTASASGISGSVDLQLSNGGTVRGNFDAPACAISISVNSACEATGVPQTGTCG